MLVRTWPETIQCPGPGFMPFIITIIHLRVAYMGEWGGPNRRQRMEGETTGKKGTQITAIHRYATMPSPDFVRSIGDQAWFSH